MKFDLTFKKYYCIPGKDESSDYYKRLINDIDMAQINPESLGENIIFRKVRKCNLPKLYKRGPYKKTLMKTKATDNIINKNCPICNRNFITANSRQKYCSNACKQISYGRRKIEKKIKQNKRLFLI